MREHKDQGDLFKAPKPTTDTASAKKPKEPKFAANKDPVAFLSERVVAARYGVHRSTIWRWVRSNPKFPKPVKLARGTSRWCLSDLLMFEASCPEAFRLDQRSSAKGL